MRPLAPSALLLTLGLAFSVTSDAWAGPPGHISYNLQTVKSDTGPIVPPPAPPGGPKTATTTKTVTPTLTTKTTTRGTKTLPTKTEPPHITYNIQSLTHP